MDSYACWLYSVQGMGNRRIHALRNAYLQECGADPGGFAEAVYRMPESNLRFLCESAGRNRKSGYGEDLARRLLKGRALSPSAAVRTAAGLSFVSYDEAAFPARLRSIPDPPYALYYRGALPEDVPAVAVVGARMCSGYGREQARRFSEVLAESGVPVISGMARGIDGIAQRAALRAKGRSWAVLGCGADLCYPEENRDLYELLAARGGVLSEYAPGTAPASSLFPARNRLIAGLSELVLLIEARERSGSLLTCQYALEQGREIMALPGRVCDRLSAGTNALIRDGAGIASCPEDVLELLLGVRRTREDAPLEGAQLRVMMLQEPEASLYAALGEKEPCGLSFMLAFAERRLRRAVRAEEGMRCLMQLQLKGLVRETGVGQYERV